MTKLPSTVNDQVQTFSSRLGQLSGGFSIVFNEGDRSQFFAEFFQHYDAGQQCDVTRTVAHKHIMRDTCQS